jgi:hypothetical protein
LPAITINDAELRKLSQGQPIADRWNISAAEVAALNDAGELLALLVPDSAGKLRATKNLSICPPT